jgi:hypothetical protein
VVSTALATVTLSTLGQTATLDVACPTGKRVLGGGYESSANAAVHTVASFPLTQTSWRVALRLSQDGPVTFTFRVYAVCAFSN